MAVSTDVAGQFLEQYKALESVLRISKGPSMTVMEYEATLASDQSDTLRIARHVRNFLQHNPKGKDFVMPCEDMLEFLKSLTNQLVFETKTASDGVYKMTPVKLTDTLETACKAISRGFKSGRWTRSWMPVVDGKNQLVGVLTERKLIDLLAGHGMDAVLDKLFKPADRKASLGLIMTVSPDENLGPYLVSKTDLVVVKNNKYAGVIAW